MVFAAPLAFHRRGLFKLMQWRILSRVTPEVAGDQAVLERTRHVFSLPP
jgi:hypothetical protein